MAKCHIVFFPFMAYGHSIPMEDMAVLFASHGVQTTIITTPTTAQRFSILTEKTINCAHQIALHIVEFKADNEAGNENTNQDQTVSNEHLSKFFEAISMLQEPVELFLQESRPDCIIADMFYPWTTKIAAKFNIPRVVFNGSGFFPLCVSEAMRLYEPHKMVSSDNEPFIVPNLPHEIRFTKKQLAHFEAECFKDFVKVLIEAMEAEVTSYGVIFNSFYELEPEYVHHYREVMKRKAWHVGPVSLCSNNIEDKFQRGKKSTIDEHECLKWLEAKAPDSVIYISFGTMVKVTSSQIYEIALGLEACNEDFIWVIKNEEEKSLPEGFEARMKAKRKGLIIKGWAPQVLILDHESVCGFVTHCGWNSVLEGVCGGVAMVAWPVMAEQFNNAKLVTDILQIGISIGDVEWSETSCCEGIKKEAIEKAVVRVMGAEEGTKLRSRARIPKEKAQTAVKKTGSSYSDLHSFIKEIKALKSE